MTYFLIFIVIFLFASVFWLVNRMDALEEGCVKAIGQLERKIALTEREKKEFTLEYLVKKWKKINSLVLNSTDNEEIESLNEEIEKIDEEIENLEEEIKNLG